MSDFRSMGCPYIAGPACTDCRGECWEPAQRYEPQPEACMTCSQIVGGMTWCEGLCANVTDEATFEQACAAYRAKQAIS